MRWLWLARLLCSHHWHAADAMILWRCCWCGKDADGMPLNLTDNCARLLLWPEEDESTL